MGASPYKLQSDRFKGDEEEPIVPATGWALFLRWYDPLVALFTNESRCKSILVRRAKLKSGLRVLDVGCGSGTLALLFVSSINGDLKVTALDADERMLTQARRKAKAWAKESGRCEAQPIQWLCGRSTRMPFEDSSFDLVTCSLVFHHLTPKDKRLTLSELERVLRPGGRLLLVDYCLPASWLARCQFLLVRMIDGWEQTRCNVTGKLPQLMMDAKFHAVCETETINSWLGTIRCYEATRIGNIANNKHAPDKP